MRKLLAWSLWAAFIPFLLQRSDAVPLDVPYQIYVGSAVVNSVVLSTANFPSSNATINANVASAQWCIQHITVSATSASTFTMAWSTSTLTTATTDYIAVTAANTPYDVVWPYREPYCAPIGQPILKLNSSVSGSSITVQGYLFKGWNP